MAAETHPGHSPHAPPPHILGISAFYHDSAACLVSGGRIIAAAQEERFTRKKHDASFPKHAAEYCLREGGISVGTWRSLPSTRNRFSNLIVSCTPTLPARRSVFGRSSKRFRFG